MTRPTPARRGYDSTWRKLRATVVRSWRSRGWGCALCGGMLDESAHVDHIVPIRLAPERRLDTSNLRVLCSTCHNSHTARSEQNARRGYALDSDRAGFPTDPAHPWNKGGKK